MQTLAFERRLFLILLFFFPPNFQNLTMILKAFSKVYYRLKEILLSLYFHGTNDLGSV